MLDVCGNLREDPWVWSLNLCSLSFPLKKNTPLSVSMLAGKSSLTWCQTCDVESFWERREVRGAHATPRRRAPISWSQQNCCWFQRWSMETKLHVDWQVRAWEIPHQPSFSLNMHLSLVSLSNNTVVNNLGNDLQCLKTFIALWVCSLVMFWASWMPPQIKIFIMELLAHTQSSPRKGSENIWCL